MMRTAILPFLLLSLSLPLPAQEIAPAPAVAEAPKFQKTDAYPLDTCIVSGQALKADAVETEIAGRVFKTCCERCPERIRQDPEPWVAKLDAAVIASQKPVYPLDTCVVSGQKLGSMGEPYDLVLDNHLIRLCCEGCVGKAKARKAEIIQKLQQAAFAQQKAAYTAKACPVMADPLEGADVVHVMHGLRLVKLCCEGCLEMLEATPNRFAAKVAPAAHKKETPAEKKPHGGHEHGEKKEGGHGSGHRHGEGGGHRHGGGGSAHEAGGKGGAPRCGGAVPPPSRGCGSRP